MLQQVKRREGREIERRGKRDFNALSFEDFDTFVDATECNVT